METTIENRPKSGPKDFFMHLLAFGMLYASAVSLISLWFEYINIKFPDPLIQYYNYSFEQIRWPMAVLIVVFPVFLILARWISKQIAIDPERKELRIYKWLVYFTLFVSAVTVIVDLITLIYNFLGGELTARFGLKILVVLIVALAIFAYYLWHLRTDLSKYRTKGSILMWITPAVVLISIILGFVFVGSPATARAQRFDQTRINDLQTLQYQIANYWQQKPMLPASLSDLSDPLVGFMVPVDPKTGQAYEYRVVTPMTFDLCAIFETRGTQQNGTFARPLEYGIKNQNNWDHDAGRVCFERTIDPDFYPKVKK